MTNYEKLKQICDEIPELIDLNVSSSDEHFVAWKTKAERFLIRTYGRDSYEYEQFRNTHFSLVVYASGTPYSEHVKACQRGLKNIQAVFETYLDEMREEKGVSHDYVSNQGNFAKVFIVHGHDGELKQSVARIIDKQGIEAIILSEQANRGKTIIEKLEGNSDVGGAVCLFTADDVGRENLEKEDKSRARQNVVLEAGYFMGKLGREHVVLLANDGIEMPSDLSGVVYTSTNNWQFDLLKELKAMGYNVDFNKLF